MSTGFSETIHHKSIIFFKNPSKNVKKHNVPVDFVT
jgi:hypothetical protein